MKGVDPDQRKEGLLCVFWKVQPIQVAGTELGFLSMNPIQIIRRQSLFQSLFKEPGDVGQASRSLMGDLKLSPELTSLLLGKRTRKHGRCCKLSSFLWPWQLY